MLFGDGTRCEGALPHAGTAQKFSPVLQGQRGPVFLAQNASGPNGPDWQMASLVQTLHVELTGVPQREGPPPTGRRHPPLLPQDGVLLAQVSASAGQAGAEVGQAPIVSPCRWWALSAHLATVMVCPWWQMVVLPFLVHFFLPPLPPPFLAVDFA